MKANGYLVATILFLLLLGTGEEMSCAMAANQAVPAASVRPPAAAKKPRKPRTATGRTQPAPPSPAAVQSVAPSGLSTSSETRYEEIELVPVPPPTPTPITELLE